MTNAISQIIISFIKLKGVYMTNKNEKKLLAKLARAHFGDSAFEKKYGLTIVTDTDYENNLEKINEQYQKQFCEQVSKKLDEEDLPESFFYDLLFNGVSIPLE